MVDSTSLGTEPIAREKEIKRGGEPGEDAGEKGLRSEEDWKNRKLEAESNRKRTGGRGRVYIDLPNGPDQQRKRCILVR